jgi:flagellar basal-body rod modification protein FlgD
MSAINPTLPAFGPTTSPGVSLNPKSIMGKDDFLKLMIAQVKNQDPFSGGQDPMQSMQQMTAYSQLEQLMNMSKAMTNLSFTQSLGSSTAMIGKDVKYVDSVKGAQAGKVNHISVLNGQVMLSLDSGSQISMDQITEVDNPSV